jgi:hypothetical protein
MMQRISIYFRLSLLYCCDQPKLYWCYPDLLSNLAYQRLIQALAVLDAPTDRIPMAWPDFFRGGTQAEKHFAV